MIVKLILNNKSNEYIYENDIKLNFKSNMSLSNDKLFGKFLGSAYYIILFFSTCK